MKKTLKRIAMVISAIILLTVITAIVLVTFISPNRFKPMIIEQVQINTGRQLVIDGELSWSFFPYLGLKAGHMSLSNPAGFNQKIFAEIDQASMGVKLLPLLTSQIETSGLVLKGVKLNLIKNAANETNWRIFEKKSDNTTSKTMGAFSLAIPSVDVTNVQVNWTDETSKTSATISDLELNAKNISLNDSFPVSTQFKFASTTNNLAGNFSLKGNVNLKNSTAEAQLVMNAQNITLHGKVNITELLSQPKVTGQFKIDELKTEKFKAKNVNAQMLFEKGILQLNPVTAEMYQGQLNGQMTVNLNGASPQTSTQAAITNIQVEPLLKDLSPNNKFKVKATGNINFSVTTVGTDKNELVRNLNGTGRFSFNKGVLEGVDIGFLMDTAQSVMQKQIPKNSNANQTPFESLTGTFTIHSGVMSNNDLLLDASRVEAKGNGTINLTNETINYSLVLHSKQQQKNGVWNLYGLNIPVHVTGSLDNPNIRLDTDAILKQAVQKEVQNVKEKVQEKVQDQIKDQLKGGANNLLKNLIK